MKIVIEWVSRAFAIALIAWIASMWISDNKCTTVKRFTLPITYTFDYVVLPLAEHWASQDTMLFILKTQYRSTIAVQQFFEKTKYGAPEVKTPDGTIVEVYTCAKETGK